MNDLSHVYKTLQQNPNTDEMPVLFLGHGSPMNAVTDNAYSRNWRAIGQHLPKPTAILSISAHWITPGQTKVATTQTPETIYDFGGFPQILYEQTYPAPGSPDFAQQTIELVQKTHVLPDERWGLDHGTWSILLQMYPEAQTPVYQLSLDYAKPPQYHYELARELTALRNKGVLIIGSGNMVHNLRALQFEAAPYDWALEFDKTMTGFMDNGNYQAVVDFQKLGTLSRLAHPTHDHFLPLLYILALMEGDELDYFNDDFDLASISMRSFIGMKR